MGMKWYTIILCFSLTAQSCREKGEQGNGSIAGTEAKNGPDLNEVRKMLCDYHADIAKEGLKAELRYLDSAENFFWVPPGYSTALDYDSVRTIIIAGAPLFPMINLHWDTLRLFPLSKNIVNYTGIVSGSMQDTSGKVVNVSLIESGIAIRRISGWKILSGQTATIDDL